MYLRSIEVDGVLGSGAHFGLSFFFFHLTNCKISKSRDKNKMVPYQVGLLIKGAVDKWLWHNCSTARKEECNDWENTPNLYLARKVVLGKDRVQGAMARSVSIGTHWPQSRIQSDTR